MSRYQIDDAPDPYQQRATLIAQVAFLTARLDEDEAVARTARHEPGKESSWASVDYNSAVAEQHGTRWTPDRVLADVAAKRAIIGAAKTAAERTVGVDQTERAMMIAAFVEVLTTVVATMVQPYADHADYDEGWRP